MKSITSLLDYSALLYIGTHVLLKKWNLKEIWRGITTLKRKISLTGILVDYIPYQNCLVKVHVALVFSLEVILKL